jgi:hypothetical protein
MLPPVLTNDKNIYKSSNRVYRKGEFVYPELIPYVFPNYLDGFLNRENEVHLLTILEIVEKEHPEAVSRIRTESSCILRTKEFYEGIINSSINDISVVKKLGLESNEATNKLLTIFMIKAAVAYSFIREGRYVNYEADITEEVKEVKDEV